MLPAGSKRISSLPCLWPSRCSQLFHEIRPPELDPFALAPLDTNQYSVPAAYAHRRLTVKAYPDRVCVYFDNQLIARHTRCYGRHEDIEEPDHAKGLIAQRSRARDQRLMMHVLALSPDAQAYYDGLEQRRLNARHHVRRILALAEIYSADAVARAISDGLAFQAFSAEYITNTTQTNIVLIGNVGVGKTHLAIALGHAACLNGHSVLFTTAVDIINTLAAAQAVGQLKREFHRYLEPAIVIVDELGYLSIDKHGADLLFQIISQRYERAPLVITTNLLCGAPHNRFNAADIVMRCCRR